MLKIYKEGHRWKEIEQIRNSHVSMVKTADRSGGETCHTTHSHGPLPSKWSISLLWQQTHHAGQITSASVETTENNQLLKKAIYKWHYSYPFLFFSFFLSFFFLLCLDVQLLEITPENQKSTKYIQIWEAWREGEERRSTGEGEGIRFPWLIQFGLERGRVLIKKKIKKWIKHFQVAFKIL